MKIRKYLLVFVFLSVTIVTNPLFAEDWLPDPNLRTAIRETLRAEIGLPDHTPITKGHLKHFTHLDVENNNISDLTGLEHATNLEDFNGDRNQISDLTPLSGLVHLHTLTLRENWISDISPLANLTTLHRLHLAVNQVSDITPLENLTGLRWLDLEHNQIWDISVLSNLTILEELRLTDNFITDISPLTRLTALHRLHLALNEVSDITPLENLTGLRWLNLGYNQIWDISVLSNLMILEDLRLTSNLITDFSPLANLTRLNRLSIKENFNENIAPLRHLNIDVFHYAEVCEVVSPTSPSTEERVISRTYPSVAQSPFYVTNLPPEVSETYHDLHINDFTPYQEAEIEVHITEDRPTEGLANRLAGRCDIAAAIYQQRLDMNPNHLLLFGTGFYSAHAGAFPENSDVWLRDANGRIVAKDVGQPWLEYQIDVVKPHVQDILIEHIVGIAKSGLYDGISIDGFVNDGAGFIGRELHPATDEEIRAAYKRILHQARLRVPIDFLILANAGIQKPVSFTEYVNGSFIETGPELGEAGYTYRELIDIEEAFLWYEENLRYPQINVLQGIAIGESKSLTSQRWMRLFTTLTLTHSNGYLFFGVEDIDRNKDRIWYDFWNADLGRPVGSVETKGQLYDNRDGVFIRGFTNGWAVYNRSGKEQQIEFTGSTTGVSSDIKGHAHTLADLDGEIYLKADEIVDLRDDGVVDLDGTDTEDATEWLPDTNLRMAVIEQLRENTGLPEGVPLRKDQVRLLRSLSINGLKISDLTGLEHAAFLQHLDATGNQITDLQPLANLGHLSNLSLNDNQISDISPLANLLDLMWLSLGDNQISDITPLGNLTKLKKLEIDNSLIEDISAVANLINLQELRFNNNLLTDVRPLANLLNLTRLNFGNNQVSNITPLRNLAELEKLEIDNNLIEDISIIANLINLQELRFNSNLVTNISPILNLPALEALNIKDNPVKNIAPLFTLDLVEFEYDESQLKASNPADVTGDGIVNILDLVAVANAFGEAKPDLNDDGVVNIQDLVIVANAFGD